MNIFYVDHDPGLAAQDLCDRHVNSQAKESVQMLVSVLQRYDVEHDVRTKSGTLHKGGYPNHPCTRWAGDSFENARWLLQHGMALCMEYTRRYTKVHACYAQLLQIAALLEDVPFDSHEFTTPALAMPDHLKTDCPVDSYRRCIANKVFEKPDSFVWKKGRGEPEWFDDYFGQVWSEWNEGVLGYSKIMP